MFFLLLFFLLPFLHGTPFLSAPRPPLTHYIMINYFAPGVEARRCMIGAWLGPAAAAGGLGRGARLARSAHGGLGYAARTPSVSQASHPPCACLHASLPACQLNQSACLHSRPCYLPSSVYFRSTPRIIPVILDYDLFLVDVASSVFLNWDRRVY